MILRRKRQTPWCWSRRCAKIDELMHIAKRLRRIALQSALGGMAASMLGTVGTAAFGLLPPIWGAVGQEVIDLLAVLNAVRVALPTENLGNLQAAFSHKEQIN